MLKPIYNKLKTLTFQVIELFSKKDIAYNHYLLKVLKGPNKGKRFFLNLSHKKESAYYFGKYDHEILKNLTSIITSDSIIWDCGTYLGYYSVFFACNAPGGKVICFEPDKSNANRTKENLEINTLKNFEIYNVAISNENGFSDFIVNGNYNSHIPGGWIGSTLNDYRKIEEVKKTISIKTATLDELALIHGVPDFIKIDIEGAELYALDKAKKLATNKTTKFLIESHNPETDNRLYQFSKDNALLAFNIENMKPLTLEADFQGTVLMIPS